MNRKLKSAAGKQDAKPALTPKLRFPEFRGAAGWAEKPLKVAAQINPANSGLPESFVYIDLGSVDAGELKAKTRISRVGAPSRAQRLLEQGDIVYQVVRPYQRNNLFCEFDDDEKYVASTGYAQLRAKESNRFLFQSVHTDLFVGRVIAKCTGSNYPAINSSDLAEIELPLPATIAEQQKIAECLTTLDDVIAAQSQKIDALKTHKKGLMQQLFPREGKTLPRLRFPEFQAAPEWETSPFEKFVAKSFYGTSSSTSPKGQYPVLRMGNMVDGGLDFSNLVYIDLDRDSFESFRLMNGDILLNRTNSPALVGKISLFRLESECMTASYIVTYRLDKDRIDSPFCNFMLNTPLNQKRIRTLAKPSVSQANINPTAFRKELIVCVPSPPEQQRIADCLTSLDDLITAHSAKLSSLKTHKKGLMQQLFPSPDEVEA